MDGDHSADEWEGRNRAAYAAFNRGDLSKSVQLFDALSAAFPDQANYHYMLGLAHKYRRDWAASLHHNLLSLRSDETDADQQASYWNAAIAATALGGWQQARELWRRCGLKVEPGDEPIDEDWGTVCVRINAWESGETLFARRRGPSTAVLSNVPFPSSGYRHGDLVLLDGAKTGERKYGDGTVPVFNALERLRASEFKTYVATVYCPDAAAASDLNSASGSGIGMVEDWTASVKNICLRCSYGIPHMHGEQASDPDEWIIERQLGIASTSHTAAESLLAAWSASGKRGALMDYLPWLRSKKRKVLDLDGTDYPLPEMTEGHGWWRELDPVDADDGDDGDDADEATPPTS